MKKDRNVLARFCRNFCLTRVLQNHFHLHLALGDCKTNNRELGILESLLSYFAYAKHARQPAFSHAEKAADFRRKPLKTAGTCRKPQIGVCPLRFVPLRAALKRKMEAKQRESLSARPAPVVNAARVIKWALLMGRRQFRRRVKSTPDLDTLKRRYTSHFNRDTFGKICPTFGRKYHICTHPLFVSRYGSHLYCDNFAEVLLGSGVV